MSTTKKATLPIISEAIKSSRKSQNLTQAELAEKSGLNRATIGRIEKGIFMPSIEQLQDLTEALNIDITTLFRTVDSASNENSSSNLNSADKASKKYNITVAGTGYVGLSLAVLLAQHNHVTAVDIIPEKVDKINNRISPIKDEYIEKYLAEKELDLTATFPLRMNT